MMWLVSSGSLRGTVKPDRPPGLWENATVLHENSRSATFNVLQVPVIDANMSISGPCRSFSSANTATKVIEKEINAAAATRQQARIKVPPCQTRFYSAVSDMKTQWGHHPIGRAGWPHAAFGFLKHRF
jgi:hypothetical protein